MAAAGRLAPVLVLVLVLALDSAADSHGCDRDTYHVSVGHLFVLRCYIAAAATSVTWSRGPAHNQTLPPGVEVRDGLLYFLPVQMSHHGSYTCEKRDQPGLRVKMEVSVSSGMCPVPPENVSISQGVRDGLPCKQDEIFRLNHTRNIRWMKDCHPVDQRITVDKTGFMRLPGAAQRDAGIYTCLVDVSVDGRKFTAARSIRLSVKEGLPDGVLTELQIVFPQQNVFIVEVGRSAELKCVAYIGFVEDDEIQMYWTVDSTHTDDYKELNATCKFVYDRQSVYRQSTLSIAQVLPQFLNVPIRCHVVSLVDKKVASMWLQEADHSALHTAVALCVTALLAALLLAAALLLFRVDLVLAYRKFLRHFGKQEPRDEKLYDAFVSFLHTDSSSAESFALQVLPEALEEQHGFSLYIRGRDDSPGEAVHDVIGATVNQCRRLIIILSPGRKGEELLLDEQNQLCYEQKIGLHDALTRNDPKVILVEIDGPVDYSHLPESLRYLKRKQGSLKWKKPAAGTHKLTRLFLNRTFWKNLRYQMPSVAAGRLQTVQTE